jgi:hypothetical protein
LHTEWLSIVIKDSKNGFLGLKNCSSEWRSNRDCERRWKA